MKHNKGEEEEEEEESLWSYLECPPTTHENGHPQRLCCSRLLGIEFDQADDEQRDERRHEELEEPTGRFRVDAEILVELETEPTAADRLHQGYLSLVRLLLHLRLQQIFDVFPRDRDPIRSNARHPREPRA